MRMYLLVGLGSAAGGLCRLGMAEWLGPRPSGWPMATLLVNVLGCYVLSSVNELTAVGLRLSPAVRVLLTTGFCGGFTTYSTFNYEVASLASRRSLLAGGGYMLLTVCGCLAAHLLGVVTARLLLRALGGRFFV